MLRDFSHPDRQAGEIDDRAPHQPRLARGGCIARDGIERECFWFVLTLGRLAAHLRRTDASPQ
jgi:hypothetical protein